MKPAPSLRAASSGGPQLHTSLESFGGLLAILCHREAEGRGDPGLRLIFPGRLDRRASLEMTKCRDLRYLWRQSAADGPQAKPQPLRLVRRAGTVPARTVFRVDPPATPAQLGP